jgi:hypothetical protein
MRLQDNHSEISTFYLSQCFIFPYHPSLRNIKEKISQICVCDFESLNENEIIHITIITPSDLTANYPHTKSVRDVSTIPCKVL